MRSTQTGTPNKPNIYFQQYTWMAFTFFWILNLKVFHDVQNSIWDNNLIVLTICSFATSIFQIDRATLKFYDWIKFWTIISRRKKEGNHFVIVVPIGTNSKSWIIKLDLLKRFHKNILLIEISVHGGPQSRSRNRKKNRWIDNIERSCRYVRKCNIFFFHRGAHFHSTRELILYEMIDISLSQKKISWKGAFCACC